MKARTSLLLAAALLSASACGSDTGRRDALRALVPALEQAGAQTAPGPTADEIARTVSPEVRAIFGDARLLVVTLEEAGVSSFAAESQTSGDVVTFSTLDGITFSFREGVLVATRGLGFDLMSADASGLRPLLATGGTYRREHRYLDGDERIASRVFTCEVTPGPEVREACRGGGIDFENTYVPASTSGMFALSRQWVGPERGPLIARDISRP